MEAVTELEGLTNDIREAKADLKRAKEAGDTALELEIRRSLNLLLQEKQRLDSAGAPTPDGAVAGRAVLEAIKEMREENKEIKEEVHSLALRQHIMNEKLPKITEVFITPSEYKKSKHKETFLDLMEIFGFGRVSIASKVEVFSGAPPLKSAELDYTFRWDGQVESASYEPLQRHLRDCGIDTVKIGEGQGLPDGLLYHEELWTLKKNVALRSEDLRKTGEEPIFKYILQGRTDLVRTKYSEEPLGKSNNRYFIEIKRVEDFVEEDSSGSCSPIDRWKRLQQFSFTSCFTDEPGQDALCAIHHFGG